MFVTELVITFAGISRSSNISDLVDCFHSTQSFLLLPFMKKVFLALAGASFALSSCSITLPVAVSSNPIGTKMGTSSADVFFGVLSFGGDASIQTAAKKAGITRVSTVDMKQSNILFIYQQFTTMVTGE